MRRFPLLTVLLIILCGCNQGRAPAGQDTQRATGLDSQIPPKPTTHEVADGQILIKPRLKFEIPISLHVLRYAEDRYPMFLPWARQVKSALVEQTLRDATVLIGESHEWQLGSLVQDYDGPDTIEDLAAYVAADADGKIRAWAKDNGRPVAATLGLQPSQFANWYAGFLERYYREGFGAQWEREHKPLVYEDASSLTGQLRSLDFSPTEFMERLTGRQFAGSTKIILYTSSFSRPSRAYGFQEEGHLVAVYRVGDGKNGVLGVIFHELLHPLIRGWWKAERMAEPIAKVARVPAFRAGWESRGKGSYPFPKLWLDELFVHAIAHYMEHKAGLLPEARVRKYSYCSYEDALYDAIFDRYDSFEKVDDFIYFALTHIEPSGADSTANFVYVGENMKDTGRARE